MPIIETSPTAAVPRARRTTSRRVMRWFGWGIGYAAAAISVTVSYGNGAPRVWPKNNLVPAEVSHGAAVLGVLGPARAPASPPVSALAADYVVTDVGCADDLGAAALERFFSHRLGPVLGFDSPRVYPLGDNRWLWALQDTFIDYAGTANRMIEGQYTNSTMLLQVGRCFQQIQRGTQDRAWSFEPGTGESHDHFFWPAGGDVVGDTFQLFWTEMIRDPRPTDPMDGAEIHPIRTWLAVYDLATLARRSFQLAPSAGVRPITGFDVVAGGDGYTYLFGNSFLQNLSLEGGYAHGPHSATLETLARVPAGDLDTPIEHWTGRGWSMDAAHAAPISSRFWTENIMHPMRLDDGLGGAVWASVTKQDGFIGSNLVLDTAPHLWGPWTTVCVTAATPRGTIGGIVTYAPIVLPWRDPTTGMPIVMLSQIDTGWQSHDGGDPSLYRPTVFDVGNQCDPPSLPPSKAAAAG